jgi:hypothetical protein
VGLKQFKRELECTGTPIRIIVIISRIPSFFPPFFCSNLLVVLCGRRRCMKLEIGTKDKSSDMVL